MEAELTKAKNLTCYQHPWEEVKKISIGEIGANLGFYLGKEVTVEGEIIEFDHPVAGKVLSISDGTGTLPIYPADLDLLSTIAGTNVYVGIQVRIEGKIATGPMITGGVQIEVEHITVIEAT